MTMPEAAPGSAENGTISGRVLVLNEGYEPITVCSAKKAMILLYLMKAELVEAKKDKVIRSVSHSFKFPSVIRLSCYIRIPYRRVELSRKNILRRDSNQCQYCGTKKDTITIDHVIPKSRGGGDTWENLVAACVKCNNRKGNRTPDEAKLSLLKRPGRPNHIIFLRQYMGQVDEGWRPFLFLDN